jgi:hypothetical protein
MTYYRADKRLARLPLGVGLYNYRLFVTGPAEREFRA